MNTVFVVDGNWYLHRSWFTLRTSRPTEQALPASLIGLVMKDACAVKATHVLIAFDGGKVFRNSLSPDYKANRDGGGSSDSHDDDDGGKDIYTYLPHVRRALSHAGIACMQKAKYEGDDIVASAADQFTTLPNTNVVIGGQDKDIYQVVTSDKVYMYDSSIKPNPRKITKAWIEKRRGLSVSQLVDFQTLFGDKTDNVKQFLTEGKAKSVLRKHGSIKKWFAEAKADDKKWLRVNQVGLSLNKKLVFLVRDVALPDLDTLVVPKLVREDMPRAWYVYQDWKYPKSKGLFR